MYMQDLCSRVGRDTHTHLTRGQSQMHTASALRDEQLPSAWHPEHHTLPVWQESYHP